MAKPFLKWAGGKTQHCLRLYRLPDEFAQNITTYVEPFLGGEGQYSFTYRASLSLKTYIFQDINPELILCYTTIKNNVDSVIAELREIQNKYLGKKEEEREKMFYETRNNWNKETEEKEDFKTKGG